MSKAVYVAYATLKSGAAREREFKSSTNAVAYARQIANEGGTCMVTRVTKDGTKVVFDARTTFVSGTPQKTQEKACEEL
jgi:hypothetical protein